MMKLFYTPGACSLAAHIALREAGLPFELQLVDLGTKKIEGGSDFQEVNSKGQVPALLLDDGSLLTEVPAVTQYIADLRPESGLAPPAGSLDRYRLQEWLNFVSSELHKTLGQLFTPNLPANTQELIRKSAAMKFNYLDRHLADNDYLLNEGFTVADGYAFNIVNWSNFFNIDLAPWPSLSRFMDDVSARPHVQAALRAEGLITEKEAI